MIASELNKYTDDGTKLAFILAIKDCCKCIQKYRRMGIVDAHGNITGEWPTIIVCNGKYKNKVPATRNGLKRGIVSVIEDLHYFKSGDCQKVIDQLGSKLNADYLFRKALEL